MTGPSIRGGRGVMAARSRLRRSGINSGASRGQQRSTRMVLGMAMNKNRKGRLTQPLVRDEGSLRPASWDEALDRAAEGFRSAVAKHGPQTFGIFSCSKTTNELNFTSQKFARVVIGSNNIDSCNRT